MHMEPPPIPFVKIKHDDKSDKDFVKLKLRRDPMPENLDFYEFKIDLFDNGGPEEFFVVRSNFNMTIMASGTLETAANIQYLRTLADREAICQFGSLLAEVESTNPLTTEDIILGLGAYFFPVNSLSKQKRVMRRGVRKPRVLKLRCYAARLIYLDDYLDSFTGGNLTEKIGLTELNEVLLNSMTNIWSKQVYVQGFECEYITFKSMLTCFNTWIFLNLFNKVY